MGSPFAVPLAALLVALATPPATGTSEADIFYRDVKAGTYNAAVVHGRRYLEAHPREDAFALDLAYAYLKLDDRDAARAVLLARDAYFHTHPGAATIWLALSYQDSEAKAYRDAIADADRALRYRPDDTQAWQQRDYAAASLQPATPDESVAFYAAVNAGRYGDAIALGERYLAAHPQSGAFAVDLAYAYLQQKNLAAAATLATTYASFIDTDTNGLKLLAALFYAYLADGDIARALAYGRPYLMLQPADNTFAIDLFYAELKAGDVAAARSIAVTHAPYLQAHPDAAKVWLELSYRDADAKDFGQAISDVNTYLAIAPSDADARAQLAAYVFGRRGPAREAIYGYGYYDGRFNDTFFGVDQTYALATGRVQPYLATHLSEDLRSGAPGTPQIYSDDALIADAGIRAALTPNVTAFVEGGTGIGLRGQGTITDARYGILYSQQWGAPAHEVTTVDASAAVYSRYAGNAIGYYTVVHVFPGETELRPLLGINGGLDSHAVFGNSFIEALYGLQAGNAALSYRIIGVEGTYLTRGVMHTAPPYTSLRVMMIFGIQR